MRSASNFQPPTMSPSQHGILAPAELAFVTSRAPVKDRLMLGLAPLGCLFRTVSETDAQEALDEAFRNGVRRFDTAPNYGAGLSEARLGRALARWKAKEVSDHDQEAEQNVSISIATKCGRYRCEQGADDSRCDTLWKSEYRPFFAGLDEGENAENRPWIQEAERAAGRWEMVLDYTGPGLRRSVAQSLERLRADRLDTLRLHDVCATTAATPASETCSSGFSCARYPRQDEFFTSGGPEETLRLLKTEKTVENFSLGINAGAAGMAFLERLDAWNGENSKKNSDSDSNAELKLNSLMLACRWNLLDHAEDELQLLRECARRGIKVHLASVFASGVLWSSAADVEAMAMATQVTDAETERAKAKQFTYMYQPLRLDGDGDTNEQQRAAFERLKKWSVLVEKYRKRDPTSGKCLCLPGGLPQLALQFAYLPSCVEFVALGVRTAAEVRGNLGLIGSSDSGGSDGSELAPRALWEEAVELGILSRKVFELMT